jgi:hypothetical protein
MEEAYDPEEDDEGLLLGEPVVDDDEVIQILESQPGATLAFLFRYEDITGESEVKDIQNALKKWHLKPPGKKVLKHFEENFYEGFIELAKSKKILEQILPYKQSNFTEDMLHALASRGENDKKFKAYPDPFQGIKPNIFRECRSIVRTLYVHEIEDIPPAKPPPLEEEEELVDLDEEPYGAPAKIKRKVFKGKRKRATPVKQGDIPDPQITPPNYLSVEKEIAQQQVGVGSKRISKAKLSPESEVYKPPKNLGVRNSARVQEQGQLAKAVKKKRGRPPKPKGILKKIETKGFAGDVIPRGSRRRIKYKTVFGDTTRDMKGFKDRMKILTDSPLTNQIADNKVVYKLFRDHIYENLIYRGLQTGVLKHDEIQNMGMTKLISTLNLSISQNMTNPYANTKHKGMWKDMFRRSVVDNQIAMAAVYSRVKSKEPRRKPITNDRQLKIQYSNYLLQHPQLVDTANTRKAPASKPLKQKPKPKPKKRALQFDEVEIKQQQEEAVGRVDKREKDKVKQLFEDHKNRNKSKNDLLSAINSFKNNYHYFTGKDWEHGRSTPNNGIFVSHKHRKMSQFSRTTGTTLRSLCTIIQTGLTRIIRYLPSNRPYRTSRKLTEIDSLQ